MSFENRAMDAAGVAAKCNGTSSVNETRDELRADALEEDKAHEEAEHVGLQRSEGSLVAKNAVLHVVVMLDKEDTLPPQIECSGFLVLIGPIFV